LFKKEKKVNSSDSPVLLLFHSSAVCAFLTGFHPLNTNEEALKGHKCPNSSLQPVFLQSISVMQGVGRPGCHAGGGHACISRPNSAFAGL